MTGDAMGIDLLATAIGGEIRGGAIGGEEIKEEEIGDTATEGTGKEVILVGDKDETSD